MFYRVPMYIDNGMLIRTNFVYVLQYEVELNGPSFALAQSVPCTNIRFMKFIRKAILFALHAIVTRNLFRTKTNNCKRKRKQIIDTSPTRNTYTTGWLSDVTKESEFPVGRCCLHAPRSGGRIYHVSHTSTTITAQRLLEAQLFRREIIKGKIKKYNDNENEQ